MLTIAYLANRFPSPVEPYVGEEIEELRGRGVSVIAGTVGTGPAGSDSSSSATCAPEISIQPPRLAVLLRAFWLLLTRWNRISALLFRVVCRGREGPLPRCKALIHTLLGACYAVQLREQGVDHIHAHHGYYGSWIAMTAARLLNAGFSLTLHGSDLLLHAAYLDVKLENCEFCLTVSDYNRRYIVEHYPKIGCQKILVSRLGVEMPRSSVVAIPSSREQAISLLAVGRLHPVKDHAFLIRACAQLQARGVRFECSIAGDGPQRRTLEVLIGKYGLERCVTLLGHVPRARMDSLYDRVDVVLLTSRSEGIPLVLMEAMARGKIVLAPAITGIPELVTSARTGFLYQPGSMGDFLGKLLLIHSLRLLEHKFAPSIGPCRPLLANQQLDWMRHAARVQVRHNYDRKRNLQFFADLFLERIHPRTESARHEDLVLQQVQLPV